MYTQSIKKPFAFVSGHCYNQIRSCRFAFITNTLRQKTFLILWVKRYVSVESFCSLVSILWGPDLDLAVFLYVLWYLSNQFAPSDFSELQKLFSKKPSLHWLLKYIFPLRNSVHWNKYHGRLIPYNIVLFSVVYNDRVRSSIFAIIKKPS